MRTVSRDDELVERGANPRTGLVSPFIVSDNSEKGLGSDYIAVGGVGPAGRTRSGKWKQDSLGWSLVESPLLSPIAQSMSNMTSRAVSTKYLGDRLLIEMLSAQNPDPKNMTDEQIRKYQHGITRAYKHEGGISRLDPDALPSPRQWTSGGPSTPPTKLHKIQRKEVGSGLVRKRNSDNTVIINGNPLASALPMPRKETTKRHKVRITAPSNTPRGSSIESCRNINNTMREIDTFLGRGSRDACTRTASARFEPHLNNWQAPRSCLKESEESPSSTLSDPLPTSQILTQHLPRLHFLHPSHFANIEASSYRRPTQLLPARLSRQQLRAVEDVCTTTFTTTSTKGPMRDQRPNRQRRWNDIVPRMKYPPPGHQKPLDGHQQANTIRDGQHHPSGSPVDTLKVSSFVAGRSEAIGPTETPGPVKDIAEKRELRKTVMRAECLRQPQCENWPRKISSPTRIAPRSNLGSANAALERIQWSQGGDGCTPTYGHLGDESRAVPGRNFQYISDDKGQAMLLAELTIGGDNRAWFSGQWAEMEETPRPQKEKLARKRSVSGEAAKGWVEAWAKLRPIQQILHRIICHVMRTLHHASLALTTRRMADATRQDHCRAIKNVGLAAVYLLILRRILVIVCKVLYWVWHPMQMIVLIVGWFLTE